jgi:hypothetical protein
MTQAPESPGSGVSIGADDAADASPRMTSPAQVARVIGELSEVIGQTVGERLRWAPPGAATRAGDAVAAFFALIPSRPVVDNAGGSGFNDSLWLFALARALQPRLIVESGTHKGHSAWLFRQACPEAAIHSFDIAPERLQHRAADVAYHTGDWTECALEAGDPAHALVFFDDHISHARRLREAWSRGFRRLLFDDNFPAHSLYATGGPPLPTLAMITDPELAVGSEIGWARKGKTYRYTYSKTDEGGAAALIADYLPLPELAPITRYPLGSALTAVRLVD